MVTKKNLLSIILAVILFAGVVIVPGNAEVKAVNSSSHLYNDFEFVGVVNEEPRDNDIPVIESKVYGKLNDSDWEIFSGSYFYDRMNKTQKAFYNDLRRAVEDFFYNEKDAVPVKVNSNGSENNVYVIKSDGIEYTGLSQDEAGDVLFLFQNENPQFYFLSNVRISSKKDNGGKYYPAVYSEYIKASDRTITNKKFLDTINSYLSDINRYNTQDEKQRRIHSLLAEKLTYASRDNTEWSPHQSTATAVLTGKSVCAGYSETYAMLCNAIGIPCICITSSSHEWNMVKQGYYWYNVDITNDQNGKVPRWKYYNVPDSPDFLKGHTPEDYYYTLGLPKASYVYGEAPKESMNYTPVYRLYNASKKEYLYTIDENEKDYLDAGNSWEYQAKSWYAPIQTNDKPIYRLFNVKTGQHLYTMGDNEIQYLTTGLGWLNEGIKFYSFKDIGEPVYRLFNPKGNGPNNHYYTSNHNYRNYLIDNGWQDEGICWYGY